MESAIRGMGRICMNRSAILTMALAVTAAWAGEDIGGAKDHPLLTRYPDSFITEHTRNYNATALL
jgi:OOP family OmpA-OmpF porin